MISPQQRHVIKCLVRFAVAGQEWASVNGGMRGSALRLEREGLVITRNRRGAMHVKLTDSGRRFASDEGIH